MKSLKTFLTFCFIWNFIITCSQSVSNISKVLTTLFEGLNFCHMKYFAEPFYKNYLQDLPFVLSLFTGFSPYSLETRDQQHKKISILNRTKFNHDSYRRYHQCFVHFYFISNIRVRTFRRMIWTSENVRELPAGFIFWEEDKQTSSVEPKFVEKYERTLSRTMVQGFILRVVGARRLFVTCIPCDETQELHEVEPSIAHNIRKMSKVLNGNIHGKRILAYTLPRTVHLRYLCEDFLTEVPSGEGQLDLDVCIHSILSKKMNYSEYTHVWGRDNEKTYGQASLTTYISEVNYNIWAVTWEKWDWIPYAIRRTEFYFVSVLSRPKFQGATLVEPFNLSIWLTIVCSFVLFLTYSYAVHKTAPLHHAYSFQTIIIKSVAMTLEQSSKWAMKGADSLHLKIFPGNRALWMIMVLVLGQFYKGKLFTYLSKLSEPRWPNQPSDLKLGYSLYTMGKGFKGNLVYSILKERLSEFDLFLKKDDAILYREINDRLDYYDKEWYDLVFFVQLLAQNVSTTGPLAPNIVLIDDLATIDVFSSLVPLLTPENIVSAPFRFSGFDIITPWRIRRTFCYHRFVELISAMLECGIVSHLEQHAQNVKKRMRLKSFAEIFVRSNFSNGNLELSTSALYNLAIHGNLRKNEVNLSQPLSFKMLLAVFLIFGVLLGVSTFIVLLEIIILRTRNPYK